MQYFILFIQTYSVFISCIPIVFFSKFRANWCAPDFLGHGKSSAPLRPDFYSLENTINALLVIKNRFIMEKPILLGYSMGGRIALHLAHRFQKEFKALILIGASPGIANGFDRVERIFHDNILAESILNNGINAFNEQWLKSPIIASQKNIPSYIRIPMQARRKNNIPIGLSNSLKKLGTGKLENLWDKLKNIDLPVFLIIGKNDLKFCQITYEMSSKLPSAKIIKIPHAGHAAHLENMPYFIDILRQITTKI